ncbi:IS30 family transposase [Anaerosolibacter sp.]|uniref:IS30 family transposase n=1 Tax=Anaerosolibacter sp. TaxID=1872527 RepID=UPI0039F0D0EC
MNQSKGNQKHLTLSQRIEIEKRLLAGLSFTKIATTINKDPSTISKEIRRHTNVRTRKNEYVPIPCTNRSTCNQINLCSKKCGLKCRICHEPKTRCTDLCKDYAPAQCEKLLRSPYVCNGCGKRINCLLEQRICSAKYADDCYRDLLVSAREGINQTPESIQKLNDLVTPLIRKGQSIAHIYASHAKEIKCSRRTLYTYIDQSVLTVRNLDMRRKVKYKKRKKPTQCSIIDREFRKGRSYEDFQKLLKDNPSIPVVEMDTVEGKKRRQSTFDHDVSKLFFNACISPRLKNPGGSTEGFDELTQMLGVEWFQTLFPVILTDNGSEFQNPRSLEGSEKEEIRTKIYYCNPNSSWQKGMLEKNHQYIRFVVPKGNTFDLYTQDDITLMINHINSEARDSLNGCTPYQLSQLLLNHQLHTGLSLQAITPDEVTLNPKLLK